MCTTDSFSAAGSAAATLTKQASALKSMGATSGNGLAQICKNQEAMQTVVGLLSATKAAMCEVKINSCSSTCSKALANVNSDYAVVSATSADPLAAPVPTVGPTTGLTKIQLKAAMNRITTAQKNCGSYQASAVNALMQTLVSGMGAMQAAKCAKLASVTPTPIPIPTPIVTTATNCSDPVQAKINIVCICQATPSNPLCGNSQNGGLAGGAGSPGVGAGGGVVAGQGAPELPSTPNVTPLNPLGADRQAGKADPIGGGGGGAAVAGAGALPGGGGAGEAGAAKAEDKSVITGLSNGGNS
jgi:hypothetical protein